ncbi:hypothetical protein [Sulfurovum sp.]|uniref:hypothetical protein n=1 Tax=Sulfurovum sp. TaxID=1969726 RepID=UPI003C767DFE
MRSQHKKFTMMVASSLVLIMGSPVAVYPVEESLQVSVEEGVAGLSVLETIDVSAKVIAIDAENRKLKLLRTDGKEITVSIGKEAVNFDQIKVDDMVSATVAKELIVSVNKQNVSTEEGAAGIVATAPKGEKPGGIIGETVIVTAKVVEIDQEKRTATIQFKDGETKTIAVRDDIDLSKHKIGEQVVFQITEMIAIKVEKQ